MACCKNGFHQPSFLEALTFCGELPRNCEGVELLTQILDLLTAGVQEFTEKNRRT